MPAVSKSIAQTAIVPEIILNLNVMRRTLPWHRDVRKFASAK
jgi:hypothetical protein